MKIVVHEDHLRITSIPFVSPRMVIFSGVPLKHDSFKRNNGKYFVTIKADPNTLPVEPSVGQHWSVKGNRLIEKVDTGDFVMQQHTYSLPRHVVCSLPDTGEQLIRFIASERDFKGIGESKARALWQLLGEEFHATLQDDSPSSRERLSSVLKADSIEALFQGYAKYKNLSQCNWMSEQNIPSDIQQRLLKHHDEESVLAIKNNPYLLIGFGMSFEAVDQLARNLSLGFRFTENDSRRLSAALEVSIRKQIEKGHTYAAHSDLRPYLSKLLKNRELVANAFIAGYEKAQYIINREVGSFHPTAQLLMESVVAKRLKSLAAKNGLFDEKAKLAFRGSISGLPYELTEMQVRAVRTCLESSVSCITGGPGTGKTTVLRSTLRAFKVMGYEIHAVALSGRATMRLNESIDMPTKTIATMLRQDPVEPDLNQPDHLLVIDEASMVDLPTMYRLVNHIHPSVRIIFSGDPDQLPPIGCGKVLSDIVSAKTIADTTLDIVKRQEGNTRIPEYSKMVNEGNLPESLSTGSIYFHETTSQNIAQTCCELFQQSPKNSRIIAPTKALASKINTLTQEAINSRAKRLEFELHSEKFYLDLRIHDAILFTKNLYDKGIQNGSLGTLTSVETVGGYYGEVTLDTGERIEVDQSVLDCMELGYAITLHKAQGSQFPRVIAALRKGRNVDRAWLYTALTRAENEIHLVGSKSDFEEIVKTISNSKMRRSHLKNLLKSM